MIARLIMEAPLATILLDTAFCDIEAVTVFSA